jgi:hypothetical protein
MIRHYLVSILRDIRFILTEFWTITVHYFLVTYLNLAPPDPSYGRRDVPYSMYEELLRNPPYTTFRELLEVADEETGSKFKVHWQSWYKLKAVPVADLVFVHGLNDYGGRFG